MSLVSLRVVRSCSDLRRLPRAAHRGSIGLLVPVVRVVREPRTTLDAQARAVVPAQRLERQCEHHRVPQQWLEVDQIVLEPADIVVLVVSAVVMVAGSS